MLLIKTLDHGRNAKWDCANPNEPHNYHVTYHRRVVHFAPLYR